MVGKGNLIVFESSNIYETGMVTPIKIGVHAQYIMLIQDQKCDQNSHPPYFHNQQKLSISIHFIRRTPKQKKGCQYSMEEIDAAVNNEHQLSLQRCQI